MARFLRPFLFCLLILAVALFYREGGSQYLELAFLQARLSELRAYSVDHPIQVTLWLMGSVVILGTLAIPGSLILTLLAGALFGPWVGTLIVGLSTTIGGCLSFLIARYLFRDFVERKFSATVRTLDKRISEGGAQALLTLRLVPASPYVVVNLAMGLTKIPLLTFAIITFLGMLPGTFLYVYAGKRFGELKTLSGLLHPPLIAALLALSLLPFLYQRYSKHRTRARARTRLKEALMTQHRNSYYSLSGVEFEGEDQARFGETHGPQDETIRSSAQAKLREHSELETQEIAVEVEDGCVFLRGTVTSPQIRKLAQESVQRIRGVKEVINQLLVAAAN